MHGNRLEDATPTTTTESDTDQPVEPDPEPDISEAGIEQALRRREEKRRRIKADAHDLARFVIHIVEEGDITEDDLQEADELVKDIIAEADNTLENPRALIISMFTHIVALEHRARA